MVVVDEPRRFGVGHGESLPRNGAAPPQVLRLPATPMPGPGAMTVFGDLDVSTIAELPAGRVPIVSHVVPLAEKPGWVTRIWERLAEELNQGRQAFVVCPAIEGSEFEDGLEQGIREDTELGGVEDTVAPVAANRTPTLANVTDVLASLRANPVLAGKRIEALHGKLPREQKDELMRAFASGAIDVLVATTVVEVGVDVPKASTMVILDADRFGVSQLHQLRGRVGRGGVPGLCLFVTMALPDTVARERVEAVASTLDGFELAQKDLELRREGDVLGSVQSGGRSSLRLLRVATDGELIQDARELAQGVLDSDPGLEGHPALRDALERRLDAETEAFLAKN